MKHFLRFTLHDCSSRRPYEGLTKDNNIYLVGLFTENTRKSLVQSLTRMEISKAENCHRLNLNKLNLEINRRRIQKQSLGSLLKITNCLTMRSWVTWLRTTDFRKAEVYFVPTNKRVCHALLATRFLRHAEIVDSALTNCCFWNKLQFLKSEVSVSSNIRTVYFC